MPRGIGRFSRTKPRRYFASGFVGSCTVLAIAGGCAQTSSVNADVAHAERNWLVDSMRPSLHTQATFPDGAKGFEMGVPIALRTANRKIPAQFATLADFEAHTVQCNANGLILGKWLNSRSVLNNQKSDVYTLSQFVVVQVIKSDGVLRAGETIVTFRVGGEVTDEGEVLRVRNDAAPDYKRGESYLLELKNDGGANERQYFASDFGTIGVQGQKIFPSAGTWAGFVSGTAYPRVIEKFKELATIPCSVN